HRQQRLLPWNRFLHRMADSARLAGVLIAVSLALGMIGYHWAAGLNWIDSLLNASMILTGMGPVSPLTPVGARLFASAYAIFSAVAFLSSIGVLVAPVFHRFLHKFHLGEDSGQG